VKTASSESKAHGDAALNRPGFKYEDPRSRNKAEGVERLMRVAWGSGTSQRVLLRCKGDITFHLYISFNGYGITKLRKWRRRQCVPAIVGGLGHEHISLWISNSSHQH
jgi:hypothetical protein